MSERTSHLHKVANALLLLDVLEAALIDLRVGSGSDWEHTHAASLIERLKDEIKEEL